MADLRIFTYLPNPRLYKATIAARYSGAVIEIVGARPRELRDWLWDYDARPLAEGEAAALVHLARRPRAGFEGVLYKTDAFLDAHPFGAVPAGFGADGSVGVFESNSIARAAARLGPNGEALMGEGPLGQSRVDSFLDRSLVFARDMQRYLLLGQAITPEAHAEMDNSFHAFLGGVERALERSPYLAGPEFTLADIVVICDLCQMGNETRLAERISAIGCTPVIAQLRDYPNSIGYLDRMERESAFAEDLKPYFERLSAAAGTAPAA